MRVTLTRVNALSTPIPVIRIRPSDTVKRTSGRLLRLFVDIFGTGVPTIVPVAPAARFGHGETSAPALKPSCEALSQILRPGKSVGLKVGKTGQIRFAPA